MSRAGGPAGPRMQLACLWVFCVCASAGQHRPSPGLACPSPTSTCLGKGEGAERQVPSGRMLGLRRGQKVTVTCPPPVAGGSDLLSLRPPSGPHAPHPGGEAPWVSRGFSVGAVQVTAVPRAAWLGPRLRISGICPDLQGSLCLCRRSGLGHLQEIGSRTPNTGACGGRRPRGGGPGPSGRKAVGRGADVGVSSARCPR